MKLILVNKGGSGSGDFGHSGRPGQVGGSSGGKGGGSRYGMPRGLKPGNPSYRAGAAKKLTDAEIDDAQSAYDTGFSSRTKGIKAYARQGLEHPTIKAIREKYAKIIPDYELTAFAVYITNAKMNGALLGMASGPFTTYGQQAWDEFISNTEIGRTIYHRMRPNTLHNWSLAVQAIDDFAKD
jgi:hypothetical protein